MAYDAQIRVNTSIDTSQMQKLQVQIDKATIKVKELSREYEALRNKEIPTEEFTDLEKELKAVQGELKKLNKQKEEFRAMGFGEEMLSGTDSEISRVKRKMEEIEASMRKLKEDGKAFTIGANPEEIAKVADKLSIAQAELQALNTRKVELLGKEASKASKACNKLLAIIKKIVGKKTENSFSNTAKKLKGIAFSMIAFNLIGKGFNGVVTSFKEGFQNIARYSSETNKVMSEFKSQTAQLKNSLATAFTPVINNILPVLTKLVSWLNTACDAMARFIAFMSGKKTYTKAKEQVVDYAESLDKASGAAKEAARSLAAFDELNVLSDNSSNSGGAGSGTNVGDMFEEADIGEMSDFAQSMKNAIEKGDWYGAGEILAKKINEMLMKANFSQIDVEIQRKISSVVSGLNGFIENLDWSLLGQRTAEGLNVVIHSLETFFETVNWKALGSGISSGIVSAISNLDFKSIAAILSAIVSSALEFLTGLIKGVNWAQLPQTVIKIIADFVKGIDVASIIESASELFWTVLASILDLITGASTALANALISAWDAAEEYFSGYIEKAGGNVILGLLYGIVGALKNIGQWIVNNIFKPFIDGFKSAFEIHSPSKVMSRMGGYLIEGLLSGIKETWKRIKTFFSEAFSELKSSITSKLNSITKVWNEKWTSAKDRVSEIWKGIKTKISEAISSVKTKISSVLTGKSGIVGIWKEAWNSVKSTTTTTFSSIWTKIKSVLQSILNGIGKMVNGAIDIINGLIGSLNNLGFDLPDVLGGGHVGFNIQKMSKVKVPQLAEGAVIKGGNPFMAILGDQRAGQTNIETPLPTMVKAFKQALAETETFGGDITFIAQLDGQVLFKETLRQAELHKNRTGKLSLT